VKKEATEEAHNGHLDCRADRQPKRAQRRAPITLFYVLPSQQTPKPPVSEANAQITKRQAYLALGRSQHKEAPGYNYRRR